MWHSWVCSIVGTDRGNRRNGGDGGGADGGGGGDGGGEEIKEMELRSRQGPDQRIVASLKHVRLWSWSSKQWGVTEVY